MPGRPIFIDRIRLDARPRASSYGAIEMDIDVLVNGQYFQMRSVIHMDMLESYFDQSLDHIFQKMKAGLRHELEKAKRSAK